MRNRLQNYTSLFRKEITLAHNETLGVIRLGAVVVIGIPTIIFSIIFIWLELAVIKAGFYNFLDGRKFSSLYVVLTFGLGLGLGCVLYMYRIQHHRLYEYIFAKLRPKYIYHTRAKDIEKRKLNIIKIKGTFEGK